MAWSSFMYSTYVPVLWIFKFFSMILPHKMLCNISTNDVAVQTRGRIFVASIQPYRNSCHAYRSRNDITITINLYNV